MKKINSFDNKLKLYSTLAMGVMSAGALNAQVVYHDVNPDVTLSGVSGTASSDTLSFDMNTDGINDFQLQVRVYGTTPVNTQANLNVLTAGGGCLASLVAYTSLGYALNIPAGTAIGPSSTWSTTMIQAVLASLYGSTVYGNLGDGADHYLGVKFVAGVEDHYGWVRVSGVDVNGTTVTLKDWAFNATADGPINAGDMGGSGIIAVTKVESNIYSFNKNVYVNFNTAVQGDINVYNSLGELVLTDKVDGFKKEINMLSFASGIYMIRVESASGNFIKKLKL